MSVSKEERKLMEQKNQESNERKRAKGIIKKDKLRKQLHKAKKKRKKTRKEMKERMLRMEALKRELRIAK